ncbi:hypothetical protein QJS10_CPB14g00519 [Acorus calamus]|uniref:Uncharacterized protein n=1 Tax=Acorus calamus TaxID=4465 RepID=A0AAV9DCR5_ACOCL|nr:hypothetical protein QJS10_CPB14g00519 [Acorus calamus]
MTPTSMHTAQHFIPPPPPPSNSFIHSKTTTKMARTLNPLVPIVLLLSIFSGDIVKSVQAEKTWCVAKPSSDDATLLANINYACSQVDCYGTCVYAYA